MTKAPMLRSILVIAALLTISLAATPARAATYTWNGGGATWSSSSTWWNSPIVATPWDSTNGTGSVADFVQGSDTPVVSGNVYVNGIQFDNTANITGGTINLVTAAGSTFSTPTITMNATSGTIGSLLAGSAGLVENGTGILTLTANNTYTGGTTINSGTLVRDVTNLSGGLNLNANTIASSGTMAINNGAAGGIDSVSLGGGSVAGAGTIAKTGSGYTEFYLTSFSGFTGQISVQAGTLGFNNISSYPANSPINLDIAGGAAFDLRNSNVYINNLTDLGVVGSSFPGNATLVVGNANGSSTFGGVIQNVINYTGYTAGGVVSLQKTGTGGFTLSGSNTYTGNTTVSGGTLNVAAAGILSNAGNINTQGGILTISGTVTQATNHYFGIGSGLSGTSGTTNINSGAVVNLGGNAVLIGGTTNNSQTGIGTFNINGGIVNVGATSGNGGGTDNNNIWINPYGTAGTSTLNLNGGTLSTARTIANGSGASSVVNFNGGTLQAAAAINIAVNTANVNAGGAIIDTQANNVNLTQTLVHGTGTPDGGLTKLGTGTLTLSTNASTFTGNVTISGGTVVLNTGGLNTNATTSGLGNPQTAGRLITVGSGATLSFTAHDVFGNAASTPAVQLVVNAGANAVTDGHLITLGPLALGGGTMTAANGSGIGYGYNLNGTVTVTGGTSTMTSSGGSTFYLNDNGTYVTTFDVAAASTLQVPGVLRNNWNGNASGLTKTDSGLMVLAGSNTYTGGTNINGGVLSLGNTGALSSVGTISFGGGTLQFTASNTTDYSSRFNTAANQAYNIDTNGQSVTVGTALTSSGGSLNKLGGGTLFLSVADTYNGNTLISAGTLQLGNNLALQNSALDTTGTGTLAFSSGINTPTLGGLTGANNLTLPANVTSLTLNLGSGVTQSYSGPWAAPRRA